MSLFFQAGLYAKLSSNPEVDTIIFPERIYLPFRDYTVAFIDAEDYIVGIIVDPVITIHNDP